MYLIEDCELRVEALRQSAESDAAEIDVRHGPRRVADGRHRVLSIRDGLRPARSKGARGRRRRCAYEKHLVGERWDAAVGADDGVGRPQRVRDVFAPNHADLATRARHALVARLPHRLAVLLDAEPADACTRHTKL